MQLGIVTIIYNGYGRFIPQWMDSINKLTIKPKSVTIVAAGKNHGLEKIPDGARVVFSEMASMGALRNLGVSKTDTEWIMYLSADDIVLPGALEEFEKQEHLADVIAIPYEEVKEDGTVLTRVPPKNLSKDRILDWGKCWIVNHSPYRKKFWEKSKYIDSEFPNFPFWFAFARLKARFVRADVPCTRYLRWSGSHSNNLSKKQHQQALSIINHYADKCSRR